MSTDTSGRAILPCGSWPTPITSEVIVASAVQLSEVRADDGNVVWSEGRPAEGGRTQLVRRSVDASVVELLSAGQNARTAVHEYGGAAWWMGGGVVWFADWENQRLYRIDPRTGAAIALTPEPAAPRGDRYADGDLSPDRLWIACIREHHPPDGRGAEDVRNEIVRLAAHEPSTPEVLVTGTDFVASPRWSPDGRSLCWLQWDHPNMPWDSTTLCVRDLTTGHETHLASRGESVSEPVWQADGSLTFIGDRTGWWNLYRWSPNNGAVEPLVELSAEIGLPAWVLGLSRYALLRDGRVVFARTQQGYDRLAVRLPNGVIADLDLPFSAFSSLHVAGDHSIVLVVGAATAERSVARLTLADGSAIESLDVLRAPRDLAGVGVTAGDVSIPKPIEFPSGRGGEAHALFYPPTNSRCAAPPGELPPLLVEIHGGPTAAAVAELQLSIQYWTSRGFAVVDVNYAGSTGFGREYRELLRGEWGVADVADCIAAARWLSEQGRVDPGRLCIRGGSAGGFTTLAALAREGTPFAAGADYFGVADLEALARDTHKFESRYLDRLIAPYPKDREVYVQRSPLTHVHALARPLIVLQGLEDEVVPPSQSEMIVDALRVKGVPVAYLAFEGEQHGFRRAENIRRALDSELSFYSQVFGFELPTDEEIAPVAIDNLPHSHPDA